MQLLAAGLRGIAGLAVQERVDTNILFFEVTRPDMNVAAFQEGMLARGVLTVGIGERMRLVTHLDVSREEVAQALDAARAVMA